MFDRLENVVARYDELTRLLADPSVINQQERYRELSKEHFDLTPLIQTYQRYKKAKSDVENLKSLVLATGDPEMSAIAEAELPGATTELTSLEEELKFLLIPKDPNDDKDCIVEIRGGTGGE